MKKYDYIVVFDLETTGFYHDEDQIIDVGAVVLKHEGDELITLDTINMICQTEKILSDKIITLTGITQSMCEHGEEPKRVYDALRPYIHKNTLLVAYNMQFDIGFLVTLFKQYEPGFVMDSDILDLLTVYKDNADYPHKLSDALEQYGINIESAHRAFDDAYATSTLLEFMRKEGLPIESYINHIGYHHKYGLKGLTFDHVTYHKQYYKVKSLIKKINDSSTSRS